MGTPALRLWPDPVLSQVCSGVDPQDPALPVLINEMFAVMYAENGRGLAAPQIGVLQRVFVIDVSWKEGVRDPRVFINPEIRTASEEMVEMDEQCLSIPDLPMPVRRPDHIQLRWSNRDGGVESSPFDGILARCIQHELDHLDGTLILDYQSAEIRAELETRYVP